MFGVAAGLILLLWVALAKTNFLVFAVVSVGVVGSAMALSFLKIGGLGLPQVLENFVSFFIGPKVYLWRKKELPPQILWKKPEEKRKKEEPVSAELKIAEKSRLSQVATNIETKR